MDGRQGPTAEYLAMKLYLYQPKDGDGGIVVMSRAVSKGVIGDLTDVVTPGQEFLGIPYRVFQEHLADGVLDLDEETPKPDSG